jgi:hypothetical protein
MSSTAPAAVIAVPPPAFARYFSLCWRIARWSFMSICARHFRHMNGVPHMLQNPLLQTSHTCLFGLAELLGIDM